MGFIGTYEGLKCLTAIISKRKTGSNVGSLLIVAETLDRPLTDCHVSTLSNPRLSCRKVTVLTAAPLLGILHLQTTFPSPWQQGKIVHDNRYVFR